MSGGTIDFKIDTPSTTTTSTSIDLATTVAPAPARSPRCSRRRRCRRFNRRARPEPTSGLVDCGNWSVSASWAVPASAVSGIYIAKPTRQDAPIGGPVTSCSSSATTRGRPTCCSRPPTPRGRRTTATAATACIAAARSAMPARPTACPGRAAKVSYNRPFDTRVTAPSFLFSAEYPMVRFLEANGYNVKYLVRRRHRSIRRQSDGRPDQRNKPKVFISVGHDEYWSGAQRTNVENARDAGVNLAFFSGNEMYWKTRWEPSIDGAGTRPSHAGQLQGHARRRQARSAAERHDRHLA